MFLASHAPGWAWMQLTMIRRWIDLFEANVDHEMFSFYHNDKNEAFSDLALRAHRPATRLLSGWGLKFFDYDNDGDLDLLLCNVIPMTRSTSESRT